MPDLASAALNFPQCRGLSSSHAAKTEHPILRAENGGNGLPLFLGQMPARTKPELSAGQVPFVASTCFTAHCSNSKPGACGIPKATRFPRRGKPHQRFADRLLQGVQIQMTQRLIESFGQNLMLSQHALPLEQMSDTGTERLVFVTSLLYFRNPSFRLSADSLQLMPFLRGQLRALRARTSLVAISRNSPGRVSRVIKAISLTVGFRACLSSNFLISRSISSPPLGKTLAERPRPLRSQNQ